MHGQPRQKQEINLENWSVLVQGSYGENIIFV